MTWVMFDYGGVVSQPPSPAEVASLAGAAGVTVPALMGAYWEWRRAYDLAELDASGYWRQVGRSLGRGFSEAEISELVRLDSVSWLRRPPWACARSISPAQTRPARLSPCGWPTAAERRRRWRPGRLPGPDPRPNGPLWARGRGY